MPTKQKWLSDLLEDELMDIYDAEKRLVKALPKMASAATDESLRNAIEQHLAQTETHVTKLESVFESLGKAAKGKKCEAMTGLLEEGDSIVAEFKGSPAINAAIIAAAQKVEHYEIASYGCMVEWSGILGENDVQEVLQSILDEEKQADETLTECAREGNHEANEGEEGEEEEDEDEEGAAKSKGSRTGSAASGRGSRSR